jgi:hypothetical protein
VSKNNLILTGIPRSGTSFICSLLNQQDDVLALVEPIAMDEFVSCRDAGERKRYLEQYFESSRHLIATQKKIVGLDLADATNTFASDANEARKNTIKGIKAQEITKTLSQGFTFAIKHPNAFTALLEELVVDWSCFAIVRNPVAIIASWSTLDHPLSRGHAPMAEKFNTRIKVRLESLADPVERQLCLVNWYFEQYSSYLPSAQVIRYESVVADAQKALQPLLPHSRIRCPAIESKNQNSLYDKRLMALTAERLIGVGGAWTEFYTADDLWALVE